MAINEKGVGKNVSADTVRGTCAAPMPASPVRRVSLVGLALAAVVAFVAAVPAPSLARRVSGLGEPIAFSNLPREARQTDQLIHAGGPFPYSKDGVVFANREGRLERRPRGYYHEYTVPTPGSRNRGARRIVCGGDPPTEPVACFYTEDHYNTFHLIVK